MVTITLPPELEQAVTEQAQKQGTAPESLAHGIPRNLFPIRWIYRDGGAKL